MTTTPGPGAQHRAQQPTQEPTRDLAHGQAHKRALGAYGEELAARHLVAAGMVVLDRNWRGPAGEIDLVLREGSTLVVCEVKTRSSEAFGTPQEAVTQAKLGRLRRLAAQWVQAHGVRVGDIRIDVVAVLRPRRGQATIEHVRGVS
ncbi:YraN family protein [Nocardioides campestrisoli]|uniref:YraN family protein n=1 Tax=Nocardioides campestrisoli TaxID=2736757 RepID=UPI0015E6FA7A|nr:YraN family protein [Nocardioides campestrisoli]